MLFFYANTIESVTVGASRRQQILLVAWRERDESFTWWWQDNRRSANGNLLFLGKQVSVAPKDVYRPSIFFFPHPYLLALAVNKSPAVYILSPALNGLWRENRGSVNRLWIFMKKYLQYSTWLVQKIIYLIFDNYQTAHWFINLGDQLGGPGTKAKTIF